MDYDFSKIPEFRDSSESFDITADPVSGRIPVTRLEHWRELQDLLDSDFFNQSDFEPIFRGHRRYDWALVPTLARAAEDWIITEELANKQLRAFKHAIRGRISDHSLVDDDDASEKELWAVGQHHGLMTPLLDWTYSPYVALFFAFSKGNVSEEKDNDYRSIYILNKNFLEKVNNGDAIPLVQPKKDDHGRLVNQAGLFTYSPYRTTIENKLLDMILADKELSDGLLESESQSDAEGNIVSDGGQAAIMAKYICKVYIKNTDQQECVKHLRQMNVHHASLFPDLIGASEYCNVIITEKGKPRPEPTEDDFEGPELPRKRVPEAAAQVFEETGKIYSAIADTPNEAFIGMLLARYAGRNLSEDGLQRVAKAVSDQLDIHLTVDWEKRDSVKAAARNGIRRVLRKYGVPRKSSDTFLKELFSDYEIARTEQDEGVDQ